VQPREERALREATARTDALAVDPFAGLHISVPRYRGSFRHHGVLIGDGTVVHFHGEPWHMADAEVVRTSVESFLGGSPTAALRVHFLHRTGDAAVPVFVPNLVALRALRAVGFKDYNMLARNCEHFGCWAQAGAMVSGQVDRPWRQVRRHAAYAVGGKLLAGAIDTYLRTWATTVKAIPLGALPPSSDQPTATMFDIGRVRWCSAQQRLVWWLPLWSGADPSRPWTELFGPRDRPWTTDVQGEEPAWQRTPPTLALSTSWHAALLADAAGRVFALDVDGRWTRPEMDLHRMVQQRCSPLRALSRTLAVRHDVFEVPGA
jgi:hypothetical protein